MPLRRRGRIRRMGKPRVVIVGCGFGGLACARKLDREPLDVLVVDSHNYHLFSPLLYQVATALLNPSDIAFPVRKIFRGSPNVRFRQATITEVDFSSRHLSTANGDLIPYDFLVLAPGSTTNFYGNEALEREALGLKNMEEALQLRNHILACLERAAFCADPAELERLLTFVIVGGGPTGVEFAGALTELLALVLPLEYAQLPSNLVHVILVEGGARLMPPFHEDLGVYTERTLRSRGVDVRLGRLVDHAEADHVVLSDGERIETRTVVWSAGVRASDLARADDATLSRSRRLEVDEALRIPGKPGAFAIGDIASVQAGPEGELPMLAAPAMQQGRHVGAAILSEVAGDTAAAHRHFRYRDRGTMATVGKKAAVAQVGRFRLRGAAGWLAWLLLHIYYLVGFRNRLGVLWSWGWYYLHNDRPIRIITQANSDPVVNSLDPAHGSGDRYVLGAESS